MTLALNHLPPGVACHISDMCTSVHCCLEIDTVQTAVTFQLTIDACEQKLLVGVDNLHTVMDLQFYKFGKPTTVMKPFKLKS